MLSDRIRTNENWDTVNSVCHARWTKLFAIIAYSNLVVRSNPARAAHGLNFANFFINVRQKSLDWF